MFCWKQKSNHTVEKPNHTVEVKKIDVQQKVKNWLVQSREQESDEAQQGSGKIQMTAIEPIPEYKEIVVFSDRNGNHVRTLRKVQQPHPNSGSGTVRTRYVQEEDASKLVSFDVPDSEADQLVFARVYKPRKNVEMNARSDEGNKSLKPKEGANKEKRSRVTPRSSRGTSGFFLL